MRRSPETRNQPPAVAFTKSPLQLEQWAAYEKITAERETERATRAETAKTQKAARDAQLEVFNKATGEQHELLSEVALWKAAEDIRQYINDVLQRAPKPISPEIKEWSEKARVIAMNIDPASARILGLPIY